MDCCKCLFWTGTFLYLVFQKELRFWLYFFENVFVLHWNTSPTYQSYLNRQKRGQKESPLTWDRHGEHLQNTGMKWQQCLAEVCMYGHMYGHIKPVLAGILLTEVEICDFSECDYVMGGLVLSPWEKWGKTANKEWAERQQPNATEKYSIRHVLSEESVDLWNVC